jgi:hypothetical protein
MAAMFFLIAMPFAFFTTTQSIRNGAKEKHRI